MNRRVTEAIKSGTWVGVEVPARATVSVAMAEYFVRAYGFGGDSTPTNVRNVTSLFDFVKFEMIRQASFPPIAASFVYLSGGNGSFYELL